MNSVPPPYRKERPDLFGVYLESDPRIRLSADQIVEKLLWQGIEVKQAESDFKNNGKRIYDG